jgi:photoactive yellow protein
LPDGNFLSAKLPTSTNIEDLVRRVDGLNDEELNALPVGLIQLDEQGRILKFNKAEADLARLNQERQIGRNFFEEVAPCTKVREFYGRFQEGLKQRSLYETFGFVFKFEHGWRNVAITLFYSQKNASVWVLVSALIEVPVSVEKDGKAYSGTYQAEKGQMTVSHGWRTKTIPTGASDAASLALAQVALLELVEQSKNAR